MMIAMALGISLAAGATAAPPEGADDLARLARRRVLFGHQSVGANIVEGLGRVTRGSAGAPTIVELKAPATIPAGTFAHAYVGSNGEPQQKLDSFDRLLSGSAAAPPELAAVKFCWADIDGATDVQRLFRDYQAKLAELQGRFPGTTFVHVTVPLTITQSGPKAWLKQLLGKKPWGLVDNARREEFNALMRRTYGGKGPLFDLAVLEASPPGGAPPAPGSALALDPANTDDGTHLNAAAQDRIARALVTFLARLP